MAKNFWAKLEKPIIALAPMAGINDIAFREICAKFGADVLYSEMASATALTRNPGKTLKMLAHRKIKQPYVVQLFGHHPEHFKVAAQIIEKEIKPQGIDINFGCPANKVLKQGAGAVLMEDKKQAREIIKATIESTSLPVSIKTRIKVGDVTILDFIDYISDLDVKAIMIHGRSLTQGFVGEIEYEVIRQVKEKFPGVVLANGGINDLKQARKTLKLTNVDGLGIARGAMGKPWIFQEIKGKESNYDFNDIVKVALEHSKLACKYKKDFGPKEMRKHLSWYIQGQPGAREVRQALVKVETLKDIESIFKNYDSIHRYNQS